MFCVSVCSLESPVNENLLSPANEGLSSGSAAGSVTGLYQVEGKRSTSPSLSPNAHARRIDTVTGVSLDATPTLHAARERASTIAPILSSGTSMPFAAPPVILQAQVPFSVERGNTPYDRDFPSLKSQPNIESTSVPHACRPLIFEHHAPYMPMQQQDTREALGGMTTNTASPHPLPDDTSPCLTAVSTSSISQHESHTGMEAPRAPRPVRHMKTERRTYLQAVRDFGTALPKREAFSFSDMHIALRDTYAHRAGAFRRVPRGATAEVRSNSVEALAVEPTANSSSSEILKGLMPDEGVTTSEQFIASNCVFPNANSLQADSQSLSCASDATTCMSSSSHAQGSHIQLLPADQYVGPMALHKGLNSHSAGQVGLDQTLARLRDGTDFGATPVSGTQSNPNGCSSFATMPVIHPIMCSQDSAASSQRDSDIGSRRGSLLLSSVVVPGGENLSSQPHDIELPVLSTSLSRQGSVDTTSSIMEMFALYPRTPKSMEGISKVSDTEDSSGPKYS